MEIVYAALETPCVVASADDPRLSQTLQQLIHTVHTTKPFERDKTYLDIEKRLGFVIHTVSVNPDGTGMLYSSPRPRGTDHQYTYGQPILINKPELMIPILDKTTTQITLFGMLGSVIEVILP